MLEKYAENVKKSHDFPQKMLFDAHFHYAICKKMGICNLPQNWMGISCAHSIEEFELQKTAPECVIQSYGMHPQNAGNENIKKSAEILEKLLEAKAISAIGEAGFDYFTSDFRLNTSLQDEIFNIQLELALKYNMLLVIHCRKANHKLFEYSKQLKKLPEVLFHSFMGPPVEAKSLLSKGINAYFSFGKQLLNGNKKAIACVRELPDGRILAETDAPFQYLKGEKYTRPSEIELIYEAIKNIKL